MVDQLELERYTLDFKRKGRIEKKSTNRNKQWIKTTSERVFRLVDIRIRKIIVSL